MTDNYFTEELLNTEIKHNILKSVLLKSISVASVSKYRDYEDMYAYVDLYAGVGIHEDGKLGSPLIALKIIDSFSSVNDFKNYKCIFAEMDNKRCAILEDNLNKFHEKMEKKSKTEISCNHGDWCDFAESIKKILASTKWGFIFADPFANQINMDLFIQILNTEYIYSLKDIMIFVNYNAFKRLIGTGNVDLFEKVANFFGITVENLKIYLEKEPSGNINFNLFNKLLIQRLESTNKDLICGTSIPNTKNGKLTKSDYFFMIFCTTDVNMADEFYNCYKKQMEGIKYDTTFFCSLHDRIDSLIFENEVTFLDLFRTLTSTFISWKSNLPEDVPTIKQIIDYLNELIKRGSIEIKVENNDVLNKRSKSFQKLKKSLKRRDMEGIEIIGKRE